MVILERNTARNEVFLPSAEKELTIVTLEEQIHARRQEIKGLSSRLHALGVLNANGLADSDFPIERGSIVNRLLEINRKQHVDRKRLRPYKRAKETKGKSPFNHAINVSVPLEFKPSLKTVPLVTRNEVGNMTREMRAKPIVLFEKTKNQKPKRQRDPFTSEITQIIQQLTNLGIQKKEQKLSQEEYRQLCKPLGHKLHDLEEQVKQNRIKGNVSTAISR